MAAGYALAESSQRRRGLLEDTRLGLEIAVTSVFSGIRAGTRSALLMPKQAKGTIGRSGMPSSVRGAPAAAAVSIIWALPDLAGKQAALLAQLC